MGNPKKPGLIFLLVRQKNKFTINNPQISSVFQLTHLLKKYYVPGTVLCTDKTGLNKINNGACVLVGRRGRKEGGKAETSKTYRWWYVLWRKTKQQCGLVSTGYCNLKQARQERLHGKSDT